jgi:hypothetical protein
MPILGSHGFMSHWETVQIVIGIDQSPIHSSFSINREGFQLRRIPEKHSGHWSSKHHFRINLPHMPRLISANNFSSSPPLLDLHA